MSNDSVTLALEGDNIPFRDFAIAVRNFDELIRALTSEVAGGEDVEWLIDDLSIGSALATQRGASSNPIAVERVVRSYPDVGRSLEQQDEYGFSRAVRRPAEQLSALINGRVTGVRFQTPEDEYVVARHDRVSAQPVVALGAVEGHVETLARRRTLRFTVYDLLHERPVYCYATPEQESLLRGIWGMHVVVEGTIYRNPSTGLPHSMRQIRDITVIPEVEAGHYKQALSG